MRSIPVWILISGGYDSVIAGRIRLENAMQKWCSFLSVLHLLTISLATLVAAFVVESIIGSGIPCMAVSLVAFSSSLFAKRFWLTATSLTTIAVGVFFIVYALIFRGFGGPQNGALPLCILFLVIQAFSIFATLADLNQRCPSSHVASNQISLLQMMFASGIFALSFAIMKSFPTAQVPYVSDWSVAFRYNWLVSVALSMLFLSVCGCISVLLKSRSLSVKSVE